MPSFRTGVVTRIDSESEGVQRLTVSLDGADRAALLLTRYAAPARPGDRVVLNVTAADLGLGSGEGDFVVWNLAHDSYDARGPGHVLKLRYTPLQSEVLAVEAPESPHHDAIRSADGLGRMPVLAASLHSQLLPVTLALRSIRPEAKIAYVMTDGGSLDIAMSRTVRRLRELGLLSSSITVGHAVGGDVEAVNVFSGLLAARAVVKADVAVVGMGPGVVGTGTAFGTSALEAGVTLNAAAALGGVPVAVVRMSAGEGRSRHAGVSHHALTVLRRIALSEVDVPVPRGHAAGLNDVASLHRVIEVDNTDRVLELLEAARTDGLEGSHMGRGPTDDPLFFLAAAAAGYHAASLVS